MCSLVGAHMWRLGGGWGHSLDTPTLKDANTGSPAALAGSQPSKARFEESTLLRREAVGFSSCSLEEGEHAGEMESASALRGSPRHR